MNIFFKHLSDPEYMHVLLNPFPVYGLAIAVIGLALALIFRSRPAIIIALALVCISGISAWPVLSYGQAAYDRVKSMSDPAGEQWLDEHMERGEKLIYAFYVLAGLAIAGMTVADQVAAHGNAACNNNSWSGFRHAWNRWLDFIRRRSRPAQGIPVRISATSTR